MTTTPETAALLLAVAPGGPCLCGRGEAVGTLTHTSGRMHFRAFHDGPALWHHENSVDWACVDCVADIASGQVREDMRRIALERRSRPATTP